MLASLKRIASGPSIVRSNRNGRDRFVGIDLNEHVMRVAVLGFNDDASLKLQAAYESHLEQHPVDSPETLARWIRTVINLLPRNLSGGQSRLAMSVPGRWVHFEIAPTADVESIKTMCDTTLRSSIFQSPAHVCYWPAGPVGDRQMLTAVSQRAIMDLARGFQQRKHRLAACFTGPFALSLAIQPVTGVNASSVVQLSRSECSVSMIDGSVNDELGIGGGICRRFPVPSETAQDGDTWESLAAWLEQVASEINNTLQYAKRIGLIRDSTQPVVIAGEIANIDGVQSKLAQSLSLPVTRWRSRFATSRTADSFNNHASVDASMAVAISLAFLAANSRGALT